MRTVLLLCSLLLVACSPQKIEVDHDCDVIHVQDRVEWIYSTHGWRLNELQKRANAHGQAIHLLENPPRSKRWTSKTASLQYQINELERELKELRKKAKEQEREIMLLGLKQERLSRGSGDKEDEQVGD